MSNRESKAVSRLVEALRADPTMTPTQYANRARITIQYAVMLYKRARDAGRITRIPSQYRVMDKPAG